MVTFVVARQIEVAVRQGGALLFCPPNLYGSVPLEVALEERNRGYYPRGEGGGPSRHYHHHRGASSGSAVGGGGGGGGDGRPARGAASLDPAPRGAAGPTAAPSSMRMSAPQPAPKGGLLPPIAHRSVPAGAAGSIVHPLPGSAAERLRASPGPGEPASVDPGAPEGAADRLQLRRLSSLGTPRKLLDPELEVDRQEAGPVHIASLRGLVG